MRRVFVAVVFSILCAISLSAQNYYHEFDSQEVDFEILFEAIAMNESGQDSLAVSKTGKYVGYVQIGPDYLKCFNQIAGYEKYTREDLFSKKVQWEIFYTVNKEHNVFMRAHRAIRLHTGYNYPGFESYFNRVRENYIKLRKKSLFGNSKA